MSASTLRFLHKVGATAALLALAAIARPGALLAADDMPNMVREGITSVLRDKVSSLLGEKDKDGNSFKRGTYSQAFKKIDDSHYAVSFNIDTIEPTETPETQQLKTQRFLLTLEGSGGKWAIAKEELKDTYVGLFRGNYADDVYKFDKLSFEGEGLKVTASQGYAYAIVFRGVPVAYKIFAPDINYEYAPPPDTGYYGALRNKYFKDHPTDFIFNPDWMGVTTDPATGEAFYKSLFVGLAKTSTGSGDAWNAMKSALDEDKKDRDKRRKESPFTGFIGTGALGSSRPFLDFVRPTEPDRTIWAFEFRTKSAAKERIVDLAYDSWEPWQVSFYATDYGRQFGIPVFAYYDAATRKSAVPAYTLEERDDLDARDFDLTGIDGKVDIGLDEPDALVCDVTYTLTTKRELRELPFRISRSTIPGADTKETRNPKLFINSVQDGEGNDLTWVKAGVVSGLIVYPKPVPSGTKLTIRLQFKNLDSISRLNPSYAAMDRGGWLPLVRFGDFIDTFKLTTRVPAKYEILGVGKKVSEEIKDDVRITQWGSDSPVTFPTIIFGDYLSDDAGKYKATKTDGTVIPVRVYVDKTSTQGMTDFGGVAAGARDIRGKQLQAIATQASVALNMYRDIYGADYPFAKLDLVADPEGFLYGQSPASIVYLGFGVFRGEGMIAEVGVNASRISKFNKDVVAYEVGHQWWGGLITNANQRNYWFVESMAELSSALYVEQTAGKKKYFEKVADWRKNVLDSEPTANLQSGYTVWGGSLGAAQANIYNKGPYAFHIFRSTFGDEKFFALLKEMTKELQHKEIVTRDMQDVMEKVVGGNMDWFFDQWMRGVGVPQYALFWTKRKNEQGKWIIDATIKQRVVFGKDKVELPGVYYRGVAPLTFVDANGKETKTAKSFLVQGAETKLPPMIVPDEPDQVYFNKDGEILAEDGLVNRSW